MSVALCDPLDCSSPGSSVHGILQARIWEWVAMPFSRASHDGINAVPLDGREGRGLLEGLQDQAGPGTGTHWHLQGEEYSSHPGKGVNTRGKKKVSKCSCFILLPISPPSKPFLMLQPHARRPEVPWTTILCHLDSHACIKMSLQALRTSGFHSNFPLTLPGAGIR